MMCRASSQAPSAEMETGCSMQGWWGACLQDGTHLTRCSCGVPAVEQEGPFAAFDAPPVPWDGQEHARACPWPAALAFSLS